MKFSIIVPVYNVEQYLMECLESINKQSYKDYEVILIDDGSIDTSGEICNEYAKNHDKFRVYHNKNSGLSASRNFGIEKSQGEYLVFIDSDDYINEDSLNQINSSIDVDTDVVVTRLIQNYPDKTEIMDDDIQNYISKSKKEQFEWVFNKSSNTWPAPKSIVKRDFLIKNELKFLEGVLHEDMDWTARLFMHRPNTAICILPWYWHRLNRKGSITSSVKTKNVIDVLNMAFQFYNDYHESKDDRFDIIFNRMMISVYGIINKYIQADGKDLSEISEVMESYKVIFTVAPNIRYKLFSIVIKFFGSKTALKLLSCAS